MDIMEGLTIDEIAKELGLDKPRTAEKRLQIAGIKPISRKALYPLDSVEKIRNWPSVGKPPKKPKDEPEKGYVGQAALYEESALEAIRNVPPRGRPPKAKPEDAP